MEVTEAPPGTPASPAGQGADDLLVTGWAARGDMVGAVAAALPEAMLARLAANVELAERLVLVEKERDEALGAAVREKAARIRLDAENRGLRERLEALTRADHARPVRAVVVSWARRAGWSR